MKHSNCLSSGANNIVILLSEAEISKPLLGNTHSDIGSASEKMKYANGVNTLVLNIIQLNFDEELNIKILAMTRLSPIDFRVYEVPDHGLGLEAFENKLTLLRQAGYVQSDIKRRSGVGGLAFDNTLQSNSVLRLIDVGISAQRKQVGNKTFAKHLETEREEMKQI